MENIRTTRNENDSYWFVINGKECYIPWNWELKVNLDTMEFIKTTDNEWDNSEWPTLNELKINGVDVHLEFPYKEYDIDFPSSVRVLTQEMAHKVVDEFNANGFHVTMEAVLSNYTAWASDMKSGYRGEDFHLFTPCGCNPLSFRATSLHPTCKQWQQTYMC